MNQREDGSGVVPGDNFGRLLDGLSPHSDLGIRPVMWSNLPSPHMGPENMLQLARDIDEALSGDHVHGAVVLHGTDLLVETSFVLDLVLKSPKPVVTTGSMRHLGEAGYDGIRNLRNGILVCLAMHDSSEVLIQMADWLFTATDGVKMDSLAVDPMSGQRLGSVGRVTGDEVRFTRDTLISRPVLPFEVGDVSAFVPLITCFPGMDGTMVRAVVAAGARGIVVEAFGAGNVPPMMEDAVVEAMAQGVSVVLATRCIRGGVWPLYGYKGGAASLLGKGVISAGSLSGTKAQLLLKIALGNSCPEKLLPELFARGA